ncbi:hypothetical protein IMCC1989_778 [gamma proteobacterium IMCC1989]|nr:hypothetical protein IMCC1989_778 [gamma proteobacterium IMCC1989]
MKFFLFNVPLLIVLSLALLSCTTERYVERPKNDEVKGGGVFSGATGEFKISDAFDEDKKKLKSGGYYILDLDGSPRMSEEEFKEFESFRAWLNSREQGTEEYKEYEAWRAFQQYRDHQSAKDTDSQ